MDASDAPNRPPWGLPDAGRPASPGEGSPVSRANSALDHEIAATVVSSTRFNLPSGRCPPHCMPCMRASGRSFPGDAAHCCGGSGGQRRRSTQALPFSSWAGSARLSSCGRWGRSIRRSRRRVPCTRRPASIPPGKSRQSIRSLPTGKWRTGAWRSGLRGSPLGHRTFRPRPSGPAGTNTARLAGAPGGADRRILSVREGDRTPSGHQTLRSKTWDQRARWAGPVP
jgi:hypothetical protein